MAGDWPNDPVPAPPADPPADPAADSTANPPANPFTDRAPTASPAGAPDGPTPAPRCWQAFADLPRAWGEPLIRCRLRACPADFVVEELLAFGPDGDGEHLLLQVRKTGANTEWTARRLAELARVKPQQIGFAGLKDRNAVTTQWFSVHLPGAPEPDWSPLVQDGIEVLACHRHRRKLRRGVLAGNRFSLLLREVSGDLDGVAARIARIARCGIPNYFGPQRFGRDEGNLHRADAMFRREAAAQSVDAGVPQGRGTGDPDSRGGLRRGSGGRSRGNRHLHGLTLSAARSQLFNELLAARIRRGQWQQALPGERLQLLGSHSHFLAEVIDAAIEARVASGDVLPTGPLFGAGEPLTSGAVADLEQAVAQAFPDWVAGLARAGLAQERRPLRLDPEGLDLEQPAPDQLRLCFTLPPGSYATALLRELAEWTE